MTIPSRIVTHPLGPDFEVVDSMFPGRGWTVTHKPSGRVMMTGGFLTLAEAAAQLTNPPIARNET